MTVTVNAYTLPARGQLPTHYEVRWRRTGGGEYILIRDLAADPMGAAVTTIHRSPATGFVYDYWVVAYRTDVATSARPSSACSQDTRSNITPVLTPTDTGTPRTPVPTPTDTATPRPVVVSPVDAKCVATAVVPAIGSPSANIMFTHPVSGQVGQLDPTHYRIFRSLTGTGNWFLLGEVPAGSSPQTVVDQSVTLRVRYYYYIVAVNKAPGVVQVSQPSTPCNVYIIGAGIPTPPLVPPTYIAAPVFDCTTGLVLGPTNMGQPVLNIIWSHRGDGTPANGAVADLFILEYRRPTQGLGQPIRIGEIPGSMTTADFMGLVRDDIYEFIITAVARPNSQHGMFMASARCTYTSSAMALPQATPAAIPTPADFQVIGWTDTSLVVGWNPPPLITDVTGYELRYRELGVNTGWFAASGTPTSQSAPGALTGLQINVPADDVFVHLSWNAPMGANANTMYEYRYSHNSQFEDGFDTVVRTTANTQVSIGTLAPDRRYYFHVRVVSNTLADSQWPPSRPPTADIALLEDVGLPPAQRCHNARTASTPLITNIVPDATTDNSFTILWDPPAGGDMGMGYQVQYSTEFTDDPISLGNAPTTATADGTGLHTQENLSPGTRYFVRVRAAGDQFR